MQKKQNKRKAYSTPQLVKMGDFKGSTGWDRGRGFELLFFWPRMLA